MHMAHRPRRHPPAAGVGLLDSQPRTPLEGPGNAGGWPASPGVSMQGSQGRTCCRLWAPTQPQCLFLCLALDPSCLQMQVICETCTLQVSQNPCARNAFHSHLCICARKHPGETLLLHSGSLSGRISQQPSPDGTYAWGGACGANPSNSNMGMPRAAEAT